MKKTLSRAIALLLVLALVLPLGMNALAAPGSEAKVTVVDSTGETVTEVTDTSGAEKVMLPANAEKVDEGDGYTVYQVTDPEEIDAIMAEMGIEPEQTNVNHYEVEDELVVAMVVVDGSAPLVDNSELGIRLGNQADLAAVGEAQKVLRNEQDVVYQRICDALDEDVRQVGSFTVLTNAFAVEVYASQMSRISKLPGVKECYIAPTFTVPDYEIVEGEDGSEYIYYNVAQEMAGADKAWEKGFTGEGMVIGIIDTGIRLAHRAFANAPEIQTMTKDTLTAALESGVFNAETRYKEATGKDLTVNDVYYSGKISFKFDYSQDDTDVNHGNADPHGTHVAGIAAAYDTTTTSEDGFATKGNAFDAQLAVFKVFDGESASFTDIVSAMEDAILLGLDAVNLSLGSPAGGTYDEGITEVFNKALEAGVNVVASAGNETTSGIGNLLGHDKNLTLNPDNGMLGVPGGYASNLAVASVDSSEWPWPTAYPVIYFGDQDELTGAYQVLYLYDYGPVYTRFAYLLGNETFEIMLLDGYASEESIAEQDVEGKVVIVCEDPDGDITTQDVYDNLKAAGAIGILLTVETEDEDYPSDEEVERDTIPLAFMEWADYDYYTWYYSECPDAGTMGWFDRAGIIYIETAGQLSDFSSWGTNQDLAIKPEISAIGGRVYSAYGNTNDNWAISSGTSMAAPQTAAGTVLVRQYLEKNYAELLSTMTAQEVAELINSILMSTANPVVETQTGLYTSVRGQGAGLIDLDQATETDAYLTVDGNRPKAELGDDAEKTGTYTITFEVNNLGTEAKTYTVNTTVQTEGIDEEWLKEGEYDETPYRYFMSGKPAGLEAQVGGDTRITVAAGTTETVTVTVTLTDAAKSWLDFYYPNGGYVEGFVFLTEEDGSVLSLPYLAFYGDWAALSTFDNEFYWDVINPEQTRQNDAAVSVNSLVVKDGDTYNYLGNGVGWNLDNMADYGYLYNPVQNYISPNSDGVRDGLEAVYVGQMRYANEIHYSIVNAETGEVYYEKDMEGVTKNYVDDSGKIVPTGADAYTLFDAWYGTDGDERVLPDGTTVKVKLSFVSSYRGEEKEEVWEFPITIDTQAPKLKFYSLSKNKYRLEAEDDGLIASISYYFTAATYWGEHTFKHTYTEETEAEGKSAWLGINSSDILQETLVVSDYAGNTSVLIVVFKDSTVNIQEDEVLLVPGETAQLHNIGTTGPDHELIDIPLSWSSSDTAVATVEWDSENEDLATVTAMAVGESTITAVRMNQRLTDTATVRVCPGIANITAAAGKNGTISDAGTVELVKGESKTYTITPDAHYVIADVLVDGVSVGAVSEYTFTNDADGRTAHTIEATFALETHQVRFLDWDDSVISTQQVAYGSAAEAPADPVRTGYTFLCWDTDFSNITAATDVKAVYVKNDVTYYYAIVAILSEGGKVEGPAQVTAGENATFTITPDKGYVLKDVLVDGTSVGCVTSYTFENVQSSHYIQAVFEVEEHKCPAADYVDLDPAMWYHEGVDFVLSDGLMLGVSENEFDPEGEMTRGQLVTVLYRMAGSPEAAGKIPFTDVSDKAYYAKAVSWAYANGIALGTSATAFEPETAVTREQLVTFFARYAAFTGLDIKAEGDLSGFVDSASVSEYARENLAWAVQAGLINGMEGNTIQPNATATRAQTAVILMRYNELIGG